MGNDPNVPAGLTGWAATEEYMRKHDAAMVQDYADDVDTLLVFAGLFSAVLTAFVVESYTMLQVDNSDTTVQLLTRISLQMESFTYNGGFVNTSAPSFPPLKPAFYPAPSALWINTLWFLSLVFSLAAALFGILAKQWLREYMQWNSALAPPRENVLVRQIRFEAWSEWNVAASISCIPALLEVALIMFVAGLVILLWTLDPIVATVITVAAALFCVVASSITLLPVFFKRCPYKSPTAWAFIVLWDFTKDVSVLSVNVLRRFFTQDNTLSELLSWNIAHWYNPSGNWRQRDRRTARVTHLSVNGRWQGATAVFEAEMDAERATGDISPGHREFSPGFALSQRHGQQSLQAIGEVAVLFKALTWVSIASQDSGVHHHIIRCTESMLPPGTHPSSRPYLGFPLSAGVRALSIWYLLSELCVPEYAPPPSSPGDHSSVAPFDTSSLRQFLGKKYMITCLGDPHSLDHGHRYRINLFGQYQILLRFTFTPPVSQTITHLIAAYLQSYVDDLLAPSWKGWPSQRTTHGRRIMELLCTLHLILKTQADQWRSVPSIQLASVQLLAKTYNSICRSPRKSRFDAEFPGLRSSMLFLMTRFSRVSAQHCNHLDSSVVTFEASPMDEAGYASLALAVGSNHGEHTAEDRHIFVWLVDSWFYWVKYHDDAYQPDYENGRGPAELLRMMKMVAQECLRSSIPNCGSYDDLEWFESLSTERVVWRLRSGGHAQDVCGLLEIFQQADDVRLTTSGALDQERLQHLLRTYRNADPPEVLQALEDADHQLPVRVYTHMIACD